MAIPEDIGLDNIQTSIFGLLDKIRPHLKPSQNPTKNQKEQKLEIPSAHISMKSHFTYLWSASWVVYGARDENSPLPIYNYRPPIIRHRGGDCGQRGQ